MTNTDQMKGKFEQFKGKVKEQWGKLTDDDIALWDGKREQFLGKVKEKYGIAQEEAEQQLSQIESNCGCSSANKAA